MPDSYFPAAPPTPLPGVFLVSCRQGGSLPPASRCVKGCLYQGGCWALETELLLASQKISLDCGHDGEGDGASEIQMRLFLSAGN